MTIVYKIVPDGDSTCDVPQVLCETLGLSEALISTLGLRSGNYPMAGIWEMNPHGKLIRKVDLFTETRAIYGDSPYIVWQGSWEHGRYLGCYASAGAAYRVADVFPGGYDTVSAAVYRITITGSYTGGNLSVEFALCDPLVVAEEKEEQVDSSTRKPIFQVIRDLSDPNSDILYQTLREEEAVVCALGFQMKLHPRAGVQKFLHHLGTMVVNVDKAATNWFSQYPFVAWSGSWGTGGYLGRYGTADTAVRCANETSYPLGDPHPPTAYFVKISEAPMTPVQLVRLSDGSPPPVAKAEPKEEVSVVNHRWQVFVDPQAHFPFRDFKSMISAAILTLMLRRSGQAGAAILRDSLSSEEVDIFKVFEAKFYGRRIVLWEGDLYTGDYSDSYETFEAAYREARTRSAMTLVVSLSEDSETPELIPRATGVGQVTYEKQIVVACDAKTYVWGAVALGVSLTDVVKELGVTAGHLTPDDWYWVGKWYAEAYEALKKP